MPWQNAAMMGAAGGTGGRPVVALLGGGRVRRVRRLATALRHRGFVVRALHPSALDDVEVILVSATGAAGRVLLAEVCSRCPDLPVVAMLDSAELPGDAIACLASGARGVIDPAMEAEEAAGVVEQAWLGVTCMSSEIVEASIRRARAEPDDRTLCPEELELLRALVSGTPVRELAEKTHRSPRTMTRVLRRLYDHIGVGNRRQAVEWAVERGLG